jgi:erythromycin esterase-like protein
MDRIRQVYACFDPFERDEHLYLSARNIAEESCEDEASKLLEHILRQRASEIFEANLTTIINALVIKDAEHYYRSMMAANDDSWNIRDRHMDTVLASLCAYFEGGKAVIWEHNTHI